LGFGPDTLNLFQGPTRWNVHLAMYHASVDYILLYSISRLSIWEACYSDRAISI